MKQETLEEAADLWSIDINNVHPADSYIAKQGFISGAKWQTERMYSKEEVTKLLISCKDRFGGSGLEDYTSDSEVIEWFEQIKNK
jgi:hypothetical protein